MFNKNDGHFKKGATFSYECMHTLKKNILVVNLLVGEGMFVLLVF